jgi:hypothetical protein
VWSLNNSYLTESTRFFNLLRNNIHANREAGGLTGLWLKIDLFTGVFDGGIDTVEFAREKRIDMPNHPHADLPSGEVTLKSRLPGFRSSVAG